MMDACVGSSTEQCHYLSIFCLRAYVFKQAQAHMNVMILLFNTMFQFLDIITVLVYLFTKQLKIIDLNTNVIHEKQNDRETYL